METIAPPATSVRVFVDPTCPFAWITYRWLLEASSLRPVEVGVELMSLSVVNDGRELDPWYRDYNDRAWRPARVAAAILESYGGATWLRFYDTFGRRRHVEGLRNDDANLVRTLDEIGLPGTIAAAADDPSWDGDLRTRTAAALEPLATDGGTPVLHVAGTAFFGPVLTAVPRGEEAGRLWDALATLAGSDAFAEVKRGRDEELRTA
ncbi:MAG TPA: disulfide bond formation protein DsbA [Nocardioidaceae bacterium]|nr:disulfide bond formation protein DsbA [Nocardioidaceae bacterium]